MSSLPSNFDMKKLSDRNYKGDDFKINPKLVKEPFNNRKCTDCFCALVFSAFLAGMIAMIVYGYDVGVPEMLLAPINSNKAICGFTAGTEGKPYLYIYDV